MVYFVLLGLLIVYFLPEMIGGIFYLLMTGKTLKVITYNSRVVVVVSNLFSFGYEWVSGITFGRFIFIEKSGEDIEIEEYRGRKEIRQEYYRLLVNHEICHSKQQQWLGGMFFVMYLIMFLYNLIKYKNSKLAYYYIPYEREARVYALEEEIYYCKRMVFMIDAMTSDIKKKRELINKYNDKVMGLISKIRQVR